MNNLGLSFMNLGSIPPTKPTLGERLHLHGTNPPDDKTLIASLERDNDCMAHYIWRMIIQHPHGEVVNPLAASDHKGVIVPSESRTGSAGPFWRWSSHATGTSVIPTKAATSPALSPFGNALAERVMRLAKGNGLFKVVFPILH